MILLKYRESSLCLHQARGRNFDIRRRINGRGLPIARTGAHVYETLRPHGRPDRLASAGDCQTEDDDWSNEDGLSAKHPGTLLQFC